MHLCLLASMLTVASCATYAPMPLPAAMATKTSLEELDGAADLHTPIDRPTLDHLVLANNPELRAARSQHGVAAAQLLQAGLLPNPSASASRGYLVSGSGFTTAWTAALSLDVKALLTLAPKREAAQAGAQAIDASLLWQEWQTLAKARLLYVDLIEGARLQAVQETATHLLDDALARTQRSIAAGSSDLTAAAPLLAASADARTACSDTQRSQLARQHQLAALLGLPPDAQLPLPATLPPVSLDEAEVRAQAADLAQRRPDLLALQLGYRAQEATLRAAVLAQFPTLSLGIAAAQDNSAVRNRGPQIGFDLPVFDRNQGGIAIAAATRQQLHDEYAVRITTARQEIDALLAEQRLALDQFDALAASLNTARTMAARGHAAWLDGNLDTRSYTDFATTALAREAAAITLEQNLAEQQVALATLLGSGMPTTLPQDTVQ
ncbi:MAG TPA: TolC family protein [Dokdonella sp.]